MTLNDGKYVLSIPFVILTLRRKIERTKYLRSKKWVYSSVMVLYHCFILLTCLTCWASITGGTATGIVGYYVVTGTTVVAYRQLALVDVYNNNIS